MNVLTQVAGEAEASVDLPIPAAAYGILALGALVALLLVAYAFRSVGSRH